MGLKTKVDSLVAQRGVRRVGQARDLQAPSLANVNIFNIVNGCIHVQRIFGRVSAAFTQNVSRPFLAYVPVGGVGGSALCALSAGGVAFALNVILTWDGLTGGNLTPTTNVGRSIVSGTATEAWLGSMILGPGTINVTTGGFVDTTGIIDWYMLYVPGCPEVTVETL